MSTTRRPSLAEIDGERRRLGIQLETRELAEIVAALHPPLRFLVFGMGQDSIFWAHANPGGRTAFVEDDPRWFTRLRDQHPTLEAHLVSYGTRRTDWKALLDAPARLALPLPSAITETAWDVIFVDGPAGFQDSSPGRMKSLFAAARLLQAGGDLFVHDAERKVERIYLRRYFARFTLVRVVVGRAVLHHYRDDGRPGDAHARWWHLRSRLGPAERMVRTFVGRGNDALALVRRLVRRRSPG